MRYYVVTLLSGSVETMFAPGSIFPHHHEERQQAVFQPEEAAPLSANVSSGIKATLPTPTPYTYSPPFAPASCLHPSCKTPAAAAPPKSADAAHLCHPNPSACTIRRAPECFCFGSRAQRCRGHLTGGEEAGDRRRPGDASPPTSPTSDEGVGG